MNLNLQTSTLIWASFVGAYFLGQSLVWHSSQNKDNDGSIGLKRNQKMLPVVLPFSKRTRIQPEDIRCDKQGAKSAAYYAEFYQWKGDLITAERFYKKALSTSKKVLGSADHETLVLNMQLFNLYMSESRYPDAEKLALEGVNAVKQVPGDAWLIGTSDRLVEACFAQKKYSQAIPVLKESLAFQIKYCKTEWDRKEIEKTRQLISGLETLREK